MYLTPVLDLLLLLLLLLLSLQVEIIHEGDHVNDLFLLVVGGCVGERGESAVAGDVSASDWRQRWRVDSAVPVWSS
jgi:hypothetical protein